MKFPLMARWAERLVPSVAALLLLLLLMLLCPRPASAIPAFARKYGLPCSACHITWPELNNFGQVFRDNGYQLMNDKDSPITRDASYFPASIRITPQWHRESASNQITDTVPGTPGDGTTAGGSSSRTVTTAGFDLSGMDMWFAGTLFKNVSFSVLPSSDSTAVFHFENAYVRFDNMRGSSWFNFKVGKYELDLPVSEKREWTLSEDGGFYYIYHFLPFGDANIFGGIGDNQVGVELTGHNANSYTRYAFSVVSSLDGGVGLAYGCTAVNTNCGTLAGRTFDYYGHFEQAFNIHNAGYMKVGAYAYYGFAPTYWQTSGGAQLYGLGNEPFYRAGAEWLWYTNHWNLKGVFLHGYDNAYLANGIASNSGSLAGTGLQAASWNGGFLEAEYIISPQWVLLGRYEMIRMGQQADPLLNPGSTSNMDAYTFASRYNPFMFSRAGLALQAEWSYIRSRGVTSQGGALFPSFCTPNGPSNCTNGSNSLFLAADFAF
jgi:hypothetical protein